MAYKQVGVIAARTPTGEFAPAVPIYKKIGVQADGATAAEAQSADWFAEYAARIMHTYRESARKEGRKIV